MYIQWSISHLKEQNWVINSDVDGLRGYHTEWSKSERDKYHKHAESRKMA